MKKTKIITTLGPVSCSKEVLRQLITEGMDVARLNLSYADYSFCDQVINHIKTLNQELNTNITIMLDLQGPAIRVGKFRNGRAKLRKNDLIRIEPGSALGNHTFFNVSYQELVDDIRPGNKLLLAGGLIELTVVRIDSKDIVCRVENDGLIEDNQELSVPGVKLKLPFLSKKDKEDIKYACAMDVDFLALSHIRDTYNVLDVNDLLIELKNDHIGLIAKIETKTALLAIDDIIKVSDGIMIARGDLGTEVPMEKIPNIQKDIIDKCHEANKVSIVATEMLASMQINKRPTRAEVSDVANAVLDGVDSVMLSGETTIGKYPVETVNIMRRIIESTEENINYLKLLDQAMKTERQDITSAIAYSVVDSANRLKVNNIVACTNSGYTARKISRFRPSCPIIATSPDEYTVRSLTLNWGVYPVLVNQYDSTDQIIKNAIKVSKTLMKLDTGDTIIITGGFPAKNIKHTNFMKIEKI